jgi:peptide/nickel transport system permease protein
MNVDIAEAPSEVVLDEASRAPNGVVRSCWRLWRVRIGVVIVSLVLAVALFGPMIAPHGETDFLGTPNERTAAGTRFGTDYLGQDVWSRFLRGGVELLVSAGSATAIGVSSGLLLGLVAALRPGMIDRAVSRMVDVMLAVPGLLLVLAAMTTLGPERWLIVAMVALTTAPRVARVTRGSAMTLVDQEFVTVSRTLGKRAWGIAWTDLIPNMCGPLLVEVNIRFVYAIGTIASLAFLGLTPAVNDANWGLMVQENRAALTVQPWGVLLPVGAIVLLTIGLGLIADGLAQTAASLDPPRR